MSLLTIIASAAAKAALTAKLNSPLILGGIGGTSIIWGAVEVGKSSIKAVDILDDYKKTDEIIETAKKKSEEDPAFAEKYTDDIYKQDKRKNKFQCGLKLAINFAKAIGLIALGLGCFFGAGKIQSNRIKGLSAAYAVMSSMYNDYRENVRQQFGDQVDYNLAHDIFTKDVKQVVKGKDGSESVVEKKEDVPDMEKLKGRSEYSFVFDNRSLKFLKDATANYMAARSYETLLNARLKAKSWVCLNEIYDCFGLNPTAEGQYIGYYYDKNDPKYCNTCIDLGLDAPINHKAKMGVEPELYIQLNPTGNILGMAFNESKRHRYM